MARKGLAYLVIEQANIENQGVRLGDGPQKRRQGQSVAYPRRGGVRNRCGLGRRCLGLEHSRAIDSRITRKQDYYPSLYDAHGSEPRDSLRTKPRSSATSDNFVIPIRKM